MSETVTLVGAISTTGLRRGQTATVQRTEHTDWLLAQGYARELPGASTNDDGQRYATVQLAGDDGYDSDGADAFGQRLLAGSDDVLTALSELGLDPAKATTRVRRGPGPLHAEVVALLDAMDLTGDDPESVRRLRDTLLGVTLA